MKSKLLQIFAVIALIFAFVNISLVVVKFADLRAALTGFAGEEGYVNLSIITVVEINFSDDSINWISGSVDSGKTYAWLYSNGTVADGNWTAEDTGFNIINIGSVNATLKLAAGDTAAVFIGGSNPNYTWNMSEIQAGSCIAATGTDLGKYSVTNDSQMFCSNFPYNDNYDEVRLDIGVKVPYDAEGIKGDTITATAAVA